jgi:hypothetical protein
MMASAKASVHQIYSAAYKSARWPARSSQEGSTNERNLNAERGGGGGLAQKLDAQPPVGTNLRQCSNLVQFAHFFASARG